jgi:hypothetical protein
VNPQSKWIGLPKTKRWLGGVKRGGPAKTLTKLIKLAAIGGGATLKSKGEQRLTGYSNTERITLIEGEKMRAFQCPRFRMGTFATA